MIQTFVTKWDLGKIIDFWKQTGVFYEPEDKIEILEKLIEYDKQAIHLIKEWENILASAVLIYHPFQSFIYRVSVNKNIRWEWIWTKLLSFIESTLKERWMLHPTIFVEEWNELAIKFYENNWWENLYKVHCLVKNLEN